MTSENGKRLSANVIQNTEPRGAIRPRFDAPRFRVLGRSHERLRAGHSLPLEQHDPQNSALHLSRVIKVFAAIFQELLGDQAGILT